MPSGATHYENTIYTCMKAHCSDAGVLSIRVITLQRSIAMAVDLPPPVSIPAPRPGPHLLSLPTELLQEVLLYLDVPDLLSLTRVSHSLRSLLLSPPTPSTLFHSRLLNASATLSHSLPDRPSLSSLSPPNATIYLTRTHLIARHISRSLISIRLSRSLNRRPTAWDLVSRCILPQECAHGLFASSVSPSLIQTRRSLTRSSLKDKLGRKLERRPSVDSLVSLNILPEECSRGGVAPGLVDARRKVVKERLKDGLRAWVERRARIAANKRTRLDSLTIDEDSPERDAQGRLSVKLLVRKFARWGQTDERVFLVESGRVRSVSFVKGATYGSASGRCACDSHAKLARKRRWERPRHMIPSSIPINERRGGNQGCLVQPTRAHVLGLRRFWESVAKASA